MKTVFKKVGKGHEVYINDRFAFWVIGSKKNAESELVKHLEPHPREFLYFDEEEGYIKSNN